MEEEWRLERSALEQLHGLRRTLFETAWRLADTYQFPDEWRLTEKQISQYDRILMDPDALRRYYRLEVLDKSFSKYPIFWYHKARAALEVTWEKAPDGSNKYEDALCSHFKQEALAALEEFDRQYIPLMREDIIAASAYMDMIQLMEYRGECRDKVLTLIQKAERMAGSNYDILQMCAYRYLEMADRENGMRLLQILVNEEYNLALNGPLLSRLYLGMGTETHLIKYKILEQRFSGNLFPYRNLLLCTPGEQISVIAWEQRILKDVAEKYDGILQEYFEAKIQLLLNPLWNSINATREHSDTSYFAAFKQEYNEDAMRQSLNEIILLLEDNYEFPIIFREVCSTGKPSIKYSRILDGINDVLSCGDKWYKLFRKNEIEYNELNVGLSTPLNELCCEISRTAQVLASLFPYPGTRIMVLEDTETNPVRFNKCNELMTALETLHEMTLTMKRSIRLPQYETARILKQG